MKKDRAGYRTDGRPLQTMLSDVYGRFAMISSDKTPVFQRAFSAI